MDKKEKKRFFLNHKKSSALVVSIAIHVALILVAVFFVAVSVIHKDDVDFKPVNVKRPKMNLRKLTVPVKEQKKTQAPKFRHNIVTKPKLKDVAIKMPEVIGVPGGTYGAGDGLGGLGFGFDMDLFGSNRGTGNEFIGTFYDLKQSPDGELTKIGELAEKDSFNFGHQLAACKIIKGFISSGFNEGRLKDYFKAPKQKYATAFMMPPMAAEAAPKAFGVEDKVKGKYWICHYKGQMAAPETGRYRFCGIGDDILVVRVGRKVVLDACWPALIGEVTDWESDRDDSRKFPLNGNRYGPVKTGDFGIIHEKIMDAGGFDRDHNNWNKVIGGITIGEERIGPYMSISCRMVIGDWIDLRKGQQVNVDILLGEIPGGEFTCRLLIEQDGKKYKMAESDAGPRQILPVFKTVPIDEKILPKMQLDPNEMTAEGPSFSPLENKKNTLGL